MTNQEWFSFQNQTEMIMPSLVYLLHKKWCYFVLFLAKLVISSSG
jgi:hypothetical protein